MCVHPIYITKLNKKLLKCLTPLFHRQSGLKGADAATRLCGGVCCCCGQHQKITTWQQYEEISCSRIVS